MSVSQYVLKYQKPGIRLYYIISDVRNGLIWFLAYHSLAIETSEAVRSCRPVEKQRKAVNRGRQMILILQVLIWRSLPSSTETFPMKTFFPWPLASTIPRLITKTQYNSRSLMLSKDFNVLSLLAWMEFHYWLCKNIHFSGKQLSSEKGTHQHVSMTVTARLLWDEN